MGDAADDAYEAATRDHDQEPDCYTCADGTLRDLAEVKACPECGDVWHEDMEPTQ